MPDQFDEEAQARAQRMAEQFQPAGFSAAAPTAALSAPPSEPACFPRDFWARLDYLLQHPNAVVESIRRDEDLIPLTRVLFSSSFIMAALYGAVMGATDLLQGAPLALREKFAMIGLSAVKVPVLFLLTLCIVIPPIHVSNAFTGARLSFRQILALLFASTAITTTILASMATVAAFFALTTGTYDFIKLLHVLFFIYAGAAGAKFMERTIDKITPNNRATSPHLRLVWLLLYGFVGMQLAWVMRPYIGSPN